MDRMALMIGLGGLALLLALGLYFIFV